jgi:hypothetical protein
VVLNDRRQSLQLLDCEGTHTVANVPLSGEMMAEARSLLPTAR